MSSNQLTSPPPSATQWDPLKVYSSYRVLLSILLFGVFFINLKNPQIGTYNAAMYLICSVSFITVSLGTLITLFLKTHINKFLIFCIVCSDIFFITSLAHASGGISSHLGILLVVSVAAGSILISGRVATLTAAAATLAILFEHFYFTFYGKNIENASSVQTAVLGVAFFATSLLAQLIATRLRTSELLRERATREVAKLEKLNYLIIQRMRTGIILIDHAFKILIINTSARQLLAISEQAQTPTLKSISPILCEKVIQWRQHNSSYHHSFKNLVTSPEINAHMADLQPSENILIFLDDTRRMAQKAQQLKLASLGQFTAAIAHEVRNPLGAISHAAQLLAESTTIDSADARLTQIIQEQSKRVNQIVENVLELSRRRSAAPQPLNMRLWLEKYINDHSLDYICLLTTQQDIVMHFDPSQLQQVLHNLLENGLRYSNTSQANTSQANTSQLNASQGITRPQSKQILIRGGEDALLELPFLEVTDSGPGVADDQIQHLFEPFFTTEAKGTGLGLYICRELCQANYASLDYIPQVKNNSIENAHSQQIFTGACFRITFAHPNKQITN